MIFGTFPIDDAVGVILAHSLRTPAGSVKKGRPLDAGDVARLRQAGHVQVVGARLEADDLAEDLAARAAATAVVGAHLDLSAAKTGRCNLMAAARGVLVVDAAQVCRLNMLDESLTLATLPPWEVVAPGQVVATVKVIPFAVRRAVLDAWRGVAGDGGPALRLAPLSPKRVALIQTMLPGGSDAVLDATALVSRGRVEALGGHFLGEVRVPHDERAVAEALSRLDADLILISGASATVDRRDVVPAGIVRAGGRIEHFGMPVDPGNLLLLASLGEVPVVDMPGCGRSPKPNGLDLVLVRLMAGERVERADVMALGVGGLLKEIGSRPLPRERAVQPAPSAPPPPRVAAVVLAAGRSSRMGSANKLLAEVGGKPLVAHAVDAALASAAEPVLVVLGHQAGAVRAALAGRPVVFVDNPEHEEGMAASVRHGVAALPADAEGALVLLGDMPAVTADHLDRLVAAFASDRSRAVCVPSHQGRRGNPVLLGRALFAAVGRLSGDVGAREIIAANPDLVREVEMADAGVLLDVDTPAALRRLGQGGGPP